MLLAVRDRIGFWGHRLKQGWVRNFTTGDFLFSFFQASSGFPCSGIFFPDEQQGWRGIRPRKSLCTDPIVPSLLSWSVPVCVMDCAAFRLFRETVASQPDRLQELSECLPQG